MIREDFLQYVFPERQEVKTALNRNSATGLDDQHSHTVIQEAKEDEEDHSEAV